LNDVKKDRICIVGFCQTSRDRTPYTDERYEVWGLNRGYIFMPAADRWFDLHSPLIRNWEHRRPKGHLQWLQHFPGPIYLHEADPEIPNSVAYPLEEIAEDLGGSLYRLDDKGGRVDSRKLPYLDSTVAYEIALAIHEGFREIMVTGVDLNTQGEYVWQRSGVSYLLGIAQGRGIDVVLPDNCPLLTGTLYGRGYMAEEGEHMSAAQLDARLMALEQERMAALKDVYQLQGAAKEDKLIAEQMVPGVDHEKLDQRRQKIDALLAENNARVMRAEGAIKETLHWVGTTPDGQDPRSAIEQLDARKRAERLDLEVNGYRTLKGEEPSESDLSVHGQLAEPPLGQSASTPPQPAMNTTLVAERPATANY
jgi:hypothetical protein